MATFFNQATLSYNDTIIDSNIVTGELVEVLSATKTALPSTYEAGDSITYVVSIVNAGSNALTDLTVTDNLGAYTFNTQTLVPLTYESGSVRYYSNGVLQPAPTVADTNPLTITGLSVPANGNVLLVYQASVNQFAPLSLESAITNVAVISGDGLTTDITVSDTITAASELDLTISKSICPDTVVDNGEITYTFVIQNTGSIPATVADNVVVTDTFNPILNPIAVTYNSTPWTSPANYTYNTTTGLFQTVAGEITVPAATYTQDPVTGQWTIVPGVTVLRVTGTV